MEYTQVFVPWEQFVEHVRELVQISAGCSAGREARRARHERVRHNGRRGPPWGFVVADRILRPHKRGVDGSKVVRQIRVKLRLGRVVIQPMDKGGALVAVGAQQDGHTRSEALLGKPNGVVRQVLERAGSEVETTASRGNEAHLAAIHWTPTEKREHSHVGRSALRSLYMI